METVTAEVFFLEDGTAIDHDQTRETVLEQPAAGGGNVVVNKHELPWQWQRVNDGGNLRTES